MILYVYTIPYMYHTLSIPFPPPHGCPHLGQPWRWPNFLAPVRAWLVELGRTSLGMLKIMNKKHGGFNQYITYISNINWLYNYLGTYVMIHNQLFIGELKTGLMQNNNQQKTANAAAGSVVFSNNRPCHALQKQPQLAELQYSSLFMQRLGFLP